MRPGEVRPVEVELRNVDHIEQDAAGYAALVVVLGEEVAEFGGNLDDGITGDAGQCRSDFRFVDLAILDDDPVAQGAAGSLIETYAMGFLRPAARQRERSAGSG